jgi:hypothetical protein
MTSPSMFWRAADAVATSSGGRIAQQFVALSWKNGEACDSGRLSQEERQLAGGERDSRGVG